MRILDDLGVACAATSNLNSGLIRWSQQYEFSEVQSQSLSSNPGTLGSPCLFRTLDPIPKASGPPSGSMGDSSFGHSTISENAPKLHRRYLHLSVGMRYRSCLKLGVLSYRQKQVLTRHEMQPRVTHPADAQRRGTGSLFVSR